MRNRKQITLRLDEEIVALIDSNCRNNDADSRSSFVNKVMKNYFKRRIGDENADEVEMIEVKNDLSSLIEMNKSMYRSINYLNQLINGGLPIFDTNTSTKVLKPTLNLRREASRKMMKNYAGFLTGDMSKEDYFLEDEEENDG
ncbi:MAG: hypothetical protein Q4B60_09145 [Erysipelotrichaceae bacterium]|nr:hypothetical protein [Erysipelotrichaceae bacterium]